MGPRSVDLLRRMLASLLTIFISVWVLLSALLYFMQPRFIYYPSTALAGKPSDIGLEYQDLELRTADGVRLHGWLVPHPQSRLMLLFLHGNAGNISHRLDFIRVFHDMGLAVLMLDYRGYGRSEGRPTEEGTYQDALAAWSALTQDRGTAPRDIVVYGQSLGGGVATWLAERITPGAVILESAFTSVTDMARHYYPYLPVGLLTRIRYPNIERVPRIHSPILFIHSRTDEIVPYEFGATLFAAANEPKSFLEIRGGHNDGFYVSMDAYTRGIAKFLRKHLGT